MLLQNNFHHVGRFIDVTDNRTSDKNGTMIQSNCQTFDNNILFMESERLKTFENIWPLDFLSEALLARTGMYYTGVGDKVKCHFCKVEIGSWELTDHPVSEHKRWSPNCPLLRRRATNNIPVSDVAFDIALPPVSIDVCGANDIFMNHNSSYSEVGSYLTYDSVSNRPSNSTGNDITSNSSSSSTACEHPEYATEAARLRSYYEWPKYLKQTPQKLAEAGFFYTGTGDRVVCFSCGGGLKEWTDIDLPWEQHAAWFSNCRYLNLNKGQKYVDSILIKFKILNRPNSNSSISSNSNTNNRNNEDVEPSNQLQIESVEKQDESKDTGTEEQNTMEDKEIEINFQPSQKSEDKNMCKICYEHEFNTIFIPCGHIVACAKCASSVTKCPVCRLPYNCINRIYFS